MAAYAPPSTDGNLHSRIGQGHRDLRTLTCCQGSEVSRVSLFCRSHDMGRARAGIETNLHEGWIRNDKRNKGSVTATLSFEDAFKEKDCSQFSSLKENIQGKNMNWLNINGKERVGVLLLNLGGPETLDDVQPFLYNLFADPDIIRLPRLLKVFQQPLASFISFVRAPKSKAGYAAIGGGSPLRKTTEDQAKALKEALLEKSVSAKIYIGMRYWHPFTEEAIEQIKKDQITRLVVLPLYPQFSISTSGSSLRLLEEIFRRDQYLGNLQHTVIPSWYQREGYLKAMATLIDKELKNFKLTNEDARHHQSSWACDLALCSARGCIFGLHESDLCGASFGICLKVCKSILQVVIFFSAHGVPRTYVEEAGDPYKEEMEKCVRLVMTELKERGIDNKHVLAYQSRVGPVEWLKPYTDDTIKELGKMGVKGLLTVPISFVSEHIETLEEIDVEYRDLALASGINEWGRVPALGCEKSFIADLADAVIEELQNVSAKDMSTNDTVWTISRTLQDYFFPPGGKAWMEWLS